MDGLLTGSGGAAYFDGSPPRQAPPSTASDQRPPPDQAPPAGAPPPARARPARQRAARVRKRVSGEGSESDASYKQSSQSGWESASGSEGYLPKKRK
ncbi:hypothetical protein MNEG_7005, partial [Monoraphidium neglectum]